MKYIKEADKNYVVLKGKKIEITYNDKSDFTKEELENRVFEIMSRQ